MNPNHTSIQNPRLFEVKALGKHLKDRGLKEGCTKMILVKELQLPTISITQKIAFAILCSLKVYKDKKYIKWADDWLIGKDRDRSNDAAAIAAHAAAYADADAYAAYAAAAAAAYAADADAADAAAHAAAAAAYAAAKLDLISIAKKAMKY